MTTLTIKKNKKNNKLNGQRKMQRLKDFVITKPASAKKVEEEIEILKQQMEFILGVTKTGLDIIDSEFNIRYIDPEWAKVYGDPTGKKCYEYFMSRREVCPRCGIPKALETKQINVTEEVLVKEDNRPIQVTTIPFQNEKGEWLVAEVNVDISERKRAEGALLKAHEELEIRVQERTAELSRANEAMQIEITERKRAEERLRESEEKYRTIIGSIEDAYYEVDLAGNLTFFNDSLCRMLGYSREELMGMNNRQYTDQENSKKLYLAFNKVYKTGNPTEAFDWEVIRKNGEKRFGEVSISLMKDAEGRPRGFRGIARDITERKRTEQALRESEAKYRLLAENATDVIWTVDMNLNVTYVSPSVYRARGYTVEEIMAMKLTDQLTKNSIALATRVLSEELAVEAQKDRDLKRSRKLELEFIRKDGSPYWSEVNLTFIRDPKGKAVGILGVSRDITESKRAVEGLQESEKKFRVLTETAASGIFIHQGGKFLYVNPASAAMTGYNREELLEMNFWDIIHMDYQNLVKERAEAQQRGEQVPSRYETKILTKNVEERWIDLTVGMINFEGNPAILGTYFDITEQKRAEEALLESMAKYRQLVEHAPIGIYEIDLNKLKFLSVNDVMCEIMGYSKEEFFSLSPYTLLMEESKITLAERMKKLLAGEKVPDSVELKLRAKNGREFWALINSKLFYQDGKPYKAQVVAQDISERKRLEEQLTQSQKMEAVGQLAGGVAHDFNNLLTVIKGYSQLSLLDLKENDPQWANLQEIEKATQRASDLTRQLLAFSRRQILDLKVLDLNTLLKDLNKMLRRIIGEDIELVTLLAGDLGRVKVDPGQIEQVVLNLAVNARDAMPSGGKLTIETANVVLDEGFAESHMGVTPGCYVKLSVSDTGIGMSPQVKEKIFEPFFTTKEKGKGTGLGLSTVYGIVKQSSGNIWVYSEPGHGTTIKIYLPIAEEEVDAQYRRYETDPLPKGNETVLLVEDEASVRDLASRFLRQQGYTVLEASNGDEALHMALKPSGSKIHLLFTDMVMPQMSGRALVQELKCLKPDIKVLYTSGYTDNAIVHHGILEHGTHFLQKPFSLNTLSHKVREALDG